MWTQKFSAFEREFPEAIRADPGSEERSVPMHRLKYIFDISDSDSEYDDESVIVKGPDKRGIVDVKAYGVFGRDDQEFTYELLEDREDWDTEQVLGALGEGNYDFIYAHIQPKTCRRAYRFKSRDELVRIAKERWQKEQTPVDVEARSAHKARISEVEDAAAGETRDDGSNQIRNEKKSDDHIDGDDEKSEESSDDEVQRSSEIIEGQDVDDDSPSENCITDALRETSSKAITPG